MRARARTDPGRANEALGPGLWLGAVWRARLASWSRAAAPREACGLLLGRREAGDPPAAARVERALWSPNLERRCDRYELDPVAHLAARRLARSSGLELLGAWHSHPGGPPEPSPADRGEALESWWYVLCGLGSGRAELAAFRAVEGGLFTAPLLGSESPGVRQRGAGGAGA